MPSVVVEGGFIECSHGGKTKITSGNQKLKINGSAVITLGMELGYPFQPLGSPPTPDNPAPCPIKTPTPLEMPSPCTATLAATSGISTKITVDGLGALLDSASGNTINAISPGTWSIGSAGQTVLKED